MKAPLPHDEVSRLEALRLYNVLDTPPEQSFDDLTLLAAHICQVPMAMVSLVDESRQWFKSKVGMSETETSRDMAFCAHTILRPNEILEVRDAEKDPRFRDSLLVTSDPHIRFYAGSPLVMRDGHTLGALCVMDHVPRALTPEQLVALRALSRQVVAQLELRRREERFRRLIENASDLITVINGEGIIGFQSPSSQPVLGYQPQELTGQSVFDYVHPGDKGRVALTLQQAIADPATPVSVEFRFRHRDGDWRTIQSIGRSIPDDEGGSSAVLNSRDLTERKKLESQLHQTQKMEAFGQLAGGIAHDFNNLLTVISGHIELLLMSAAGDGTVRESFTEIRKAGERAAALTRQLLAFSRQQVLEPRVVDLNTIVSDAKSMLERLLGANISLVSTLSPNLKPVKVDPGQLDQAIMNLAVNARDAMPRGGQLVIETRNVELNASNPPVRADLHPGPYVLLIVSDNGCGMTPDVQSHIFEPFFTTKGVGKGTGLGLAVVHGIIKQSAGHMEVESKVGTGTTFRIYLPAVQEQPTRTSDTGVFRAAHGRETLLLVEDEDPVRQLIAISLQRFGYTVFKAANGQEALALANDVKTIDLLLTDLVMPEMSGRELAEEFGQRFPGAKILYLSGYTDDAAIRHGVLEAGAAFLHKPFTPLALARKIRDVLDR